MLHKVYAKIVQAKNPIALPYRLVDDMTDWAEGVYLRALSKMNDKKTPEYDKWRMFKNSCYSSKVFSFKTPYKNTENSVILEISPYLESEGQPGISPVVFAGESKTIFGESKIEITFRLTKTDITSKLRRIIYEAISHELTHVIESIINPNYAKDLDSGQGKYKEYHKFEEYYFNSDFEVAAYGRNVYDAIKKTTKNSIKASLIRGNTMEEIQSSKNEIFRRIYENVKLKNPKLYKYTSQENKRKLDQLAFKGFDDAFEEWQDKNA